MKITIGELFRLHQTAVHARGQSTLGKDPSVGSGGVNYGTTLVASVRIAQLLEDCKLKVEIPPEMESLPFISNFVANEKRWRQQQHLDNIAFLFGRR